MDDNQNLVNAIEILSSYKNEDLTKRISEIESSIINNKLDKKKIKKICGKYNITDDLYNASKVIKKMSAEIDVVIHSIGILRSLENILEDDEIVESVSLGAGNTNRSFDLETNYRIAEYKFIDWKGGAESIRQNGIFKDFHLLVRENTKKKKYLYLNGTDIPLKFFKGGRALSSVLSRYPKILKEIQAYPNTDIKCVRDYYEIYKNDVEIVDISSI